MKLSAITYLTLLLTITSCSIVDTDSNQSTIVGQWEWIKSTGGFAGHTITPDSTGYSEQFLNYSINNEFSFFRADTLVVSGKYFLDKENGETIVKYSPENDRFFPNQWIERNRNDTLILRDTCADCYTSTYIRKN